MNLHLKTKPNRQTAQAMIEFALVFPLLVFVLYGILEFGRMLFIYTSVVNSSREAARYGSSVGNLGSFRFNDCAGILAAAQRNAILNTITTGNMQISYDRGPGTASYSTDCATLNPDDVILGDRINVTVTIQYTPLMPINFASFPISSRASRTIIRNVEISGSVLGAPGIPTVNFSASELPEPRNEGAGTVIFSVQLDYPTDVTVVVPLNLSGTAINGVDYTINTTSVSLPAGETSYNVIITLLDDTLDEYNETIIVSMGTPVNANKGTPNVFTMVIDDNDDPPQIFFQVPASSGNEDTNVGIIVALSAVSGKEISFTYNFESTTSTAVLGTDFTVGPSSPVTIPAGSGGTSLNAVLRRDGIYEHDELANFRLTGVVTDSIDPGTPTAILDTSRAAHALTIINIDPPPVVAWELESSTVSEELTVRSFLAMRIDRVSAIDVVVTIRVTPVTAQYPQDFRFVNGFTYTIPAGSLEAEAEMEIADGEGWEVDETARIEIVTAVDGTIGNPSTHTLTITESLIPPVVQFLSAGQSIDESGFPTPARIYMSNAWGIDITVNVTVAGTAQTGVDYNLTKPIPVVIRAGRFSADIDIALIDDFLDEDNETIIFTITSVTAPATRGALYVRTVTILDNDESPKVSFSQSASSYEEGTANISLQVNLTAASARNISVNFSTTGTAIAGTDYTLLTTSPLIFPPGTTSKTINLNLIDDSLYTGLRDVIFTLSGPVNATLQAPQVHTLTIIENEVCPTLVGWAPNGSDQATATVSLPTGATTVTLSEMTVTFKAGGAQRFEKVYFGTGGSSLIFDGSLSASPATISGASWTGGDRTLNGGVGKTILLTFKKTFTTAEFNQYFSMLIRWSNGCTARVP